MAANRMRFKDTVHFITNRCEHEMFLLLPNPMDGVDSVDGVDLVDGVDSVDGVDPVAGVDQGDGLGMGVDSGFVSVEVRRG